MLRDCHALTVIRHTKVEIIFLPLKYHVPDVEAHVMPDGKLYIYGSFDELEDRFCSEKYYVVSTPDLKYWTVHDTALSGREIPWFNNPDAPKYPGIDWFHPTPFILKIAIYSFILFIFYCLFSVSSTI